MAAEKVVIYNFPPSHTSAPPLPAVSKSFASWEVGELSVKPSVGEGLPPYVERAHDLELRQCLRKIRNGSSSVVVIEGNSCAGKTRAAYEGAGTELHDWALLYPHSADDLRQAAAKGLVRPRTIIWLDDAHSTVLADRDGEEAAALLLTLKDAVSHLAIVVTIWPGNYEMLTGAAPASQGQDRLARRRTLLQASHRVTVPDTFTDRELDDFQRRVTDPQWVQAVDSARGTQELTQTLAAAVELMHRYRRSDHPGKALVTAAADFRRLGVREPIPVRTLTAAAPGYLTSHARMKLVGDWAATALAWAREPCHGVCPALPPVLHPDGIGPDPDRCDLNDYLEQHIAEERAFTAPPSPFWQAALTADLGGLSYAKLGTAAFSSARFKIARDLYIKALERHHTPAFSDLCVLYSETGMIHTRRGIDELLALCEPIEDGGESAFHLGTDISYVATGQVDAEYRERSVELATALLERAAEAGQALARTALVMMYEDLGQLGEAAAVARVADASEAQQEHPAALLHQAAEGDADALHELKRLAHTGGPRWHALVETAFDVPSRLCAWPSKLSKQGERDLARQLLDAGVAAKSAAALGMLLDFLDRPEDQQEAAALKRSAAETDPHFLFQLFMELWPERRREALALLSRARRQRRHGAVRIVVRHLHKIPSARHTAEDIANILAMRDRQPWAQYELALWMYERLETTEEGLPPLESIPDEVFALMEAAAAHHQDARRLWGQLLSRMGREYEAREALFAAVDSGDYTIVTHGELGEHLFPDQPTKAEQLKMYGLTAEGEPHDVW
ncbi:hypothetical protein ACWDN6_16300 [Streptomyces albogriseolus]|uniref:hypothetical protein n=1 Tax=Streptomyces albogriseolus TaxID=1887 RepID=UPI00345F5210